ncbi:MAG: hypothetical protein LBH20_06995 [Treponema sp.]|nr:hypothetical protein [Treponema sp.]
MKIKIIDPYSQVCWMIVLLILVSACDRKKDETPVIPPLTSPLSQSFIGFGVVNVSYTRVAAQPEEDVSAEDTASPGYLRRGSVVCILQRRLIKNQEKPESWVFVEGSCTGWLKESLVDIYDTESQARTASESMGR